ncbi:MAG: hypothetical protein JXJ04_02260 [Spirochaetales bacterium]|nr:hypothetical protein [Spirochaetales bacterium]
MISKYKFFLLCIALIAVSTIQSYAVNSGYLGYWENVDCNTKGITKFYLNKGLDKYSLGIHVYGSCHPSDCDWGHTPLYVYGIDTNDKTHQHATAVYEMDFSITILTLEFMNDGRLILDSYTQFTDNSNRQNYHSYDIFKKVSNETETVTPKCPDLIVESIDPDKYRKGDKEIIIEAVIKNIGNARAGKSVAYITDKTNKQPTGNLYDAMEDVPPLKPGESVTVTFTIRYKGKFKPKIAVKVEADFKKTVDECNENNNDKTYQ